MTSSSQAVPLPDDIGAYLALNGWQRVEGGRAASIWSNRSLRDADGSQLLMPHLREASDYADRVALLLDQVAIVKRESVDKVRQDAALVHFDVAPIRASDESAIDDSIPLQAGLELMTAARKMIVAAAGATERRASHFGRSLSGRAREHSQVVRLGQTRRGSYIVPIISRARFSLEPERHEEHLDVGVEESLFERRVMSTFATALGTLEEIAVTSGRSVKGSELSDAVSVGVSRELCMGVLRALKSASISDLQIAFNWAPASVPPRHAPTEVQFPDAAIDELVDVAERLRTLDVPRSDVLYGLVTELRHRPNDPSPRVGVEALVGRRVRIVYMDVTPEQYEVAQWCHERYKVMVRGKLRAPTGDRAEMTEVEYFGQDQALDLPNLPPPLARGSAPSDSGPVPDSPRRALNRPRVPKKSKGLPRGSEGPSGSSG